MEYYPAVWMKRCKMLALLLMKREWKNVNFVKHHLTILMDHHKMVPAYPDFMKPLWYICCSQYAHNFLMRTKTPHMQNFRTPSPYAYGESPYAYGDQFVMCQWSFRQSRVEAEFCARTRTHSYQKSSMYHIIQIASHSPFGFGDISQSLSICGITSVRFYHFTLWNLNR